MVVLGAEGVVMWPNSLGGTSGCSGGAGGTDLGGLAASTTSASELFGPAFGTSAAGPYGALKTNPYVSALGMPPIEALHSSIGYPGCTPAGESYYCEYTSYSLINANIVLLIRQQFFMLLNKLLFKLLMICRSIKI